MSQFWIKEISLEMFEFILILLLIYISSLLVINVDRYQVFTNNKLIKLFEAAVYMSRIISYVREIVFFLFKIMIFSLDKDMTKYKTYLND